MQFYDSFLETVKLFSRKENLRLLEDNHYNTEVKIMPAANYYAWG